MPPTKRNQTFKYEQSQSYQFNFNIDEADEINNETTIDVGMTPLHDDLQQQNLTPDQLEQLLSQVNSELVAESTDDQEFFKREATIKPPKTRKVIQTPFSPPPSDRKENIDISVEQLKQLAKKEPDSLIIERYSPNKKEIDHALSTITLTFNQSMINISSLNEQINTEDLGISLTPKIEGQWKWMGTKTVQFQAKYRLPYSTKYTLAVNKEHCVSTIGGKLDDEFFFEFSTKTSQVLQFLPNGKASTLKPSCFLLFNQKIDRNEIFKHLCVVDDDEHQIQNNQLELLDEITAKEEFEWCIDQNEEQYIAFTFKNDLLKATQYTIVVPIGCPSAEGPLKSTSEWSDTFYTYEPFKITDWFPNTNDMSEDAAFPGQSWSLTFNNPIDSSTIKKSLFKFEPEVNDLGIEYGQNSDREILLHNNSQSNTIYTLVIQSQILKDIYGQILEHDYSDQPIQFYVQDFNSSSFGMLSGESGMIIMDPGLLDEPYYSFLVYNYSELILRINRVKPEHYRSDLFHFNEDFDKDQKKEWYEKLPGEILFNQIIQTNCQHNELKEIKVPLKTYFTKSSGVGQLFISIIPTTKAYKQFEHRSWENRPSILVWLQCTRLAVDIFASYDMNSTLIAWVTDLMTGVPINQATVSISNKKNETNQQGLCIIKRYKGEENEILIVEKDDDLCMKVDIHRYQSDDDCYVWHVINDRGLYRPNEDVNIKGYLRLLKNEGQAKLPTYVQGVIDYQIHDSRREQFQQSKVELNNYGAFHIKFTLPDNVNLGKACINLSLSDSKIDTKHYFQIEEFRKPEFIVSSMIQSPISYYSHPTIDQYVIANCEGKLFSGGYLTNANVQWTIRAKPITFKPANRSEYTFGRSKPRSRYSDDYDQSEIYPKKHFQGKINNKGIHEIKISYHGIEQQPRTIMIYALATITDLNNQTEETETKFLIHPCKYYVGFKFNKNYGKKDKIVQTKVIVTDIHGNLIENIFIECKIFGSGKQKTEDQNGLTIFQQITDEQILTNVSSNKDSVNIDFTPLLEGIYNISYSIKDEQGRLARSLQDHFYVSNHSGEEIEDQKVNYVQTDEIQIIPNATNYQPDDLCELLIRAPFSPAYGLLIFNSQSIQFQIESGKKSTIVQFKISKDWIPNFNVHVKLTGSIQREIKLINSPNRPAIAVGSISIKVSKDIYKLNVLINTKETNKMFTPSSIIHIDVDVKQYIDNVSVDKTEVCLIIVDEAILSLTDHKLDSPLDIFYLNRSENITEYHCRDRCLLFNPPDIQQLQKKIQKDRYWDDSEGGGGGGGGGGGKRSMFMSNAPKIAVRLNFNPLACWIPSSITDSSGHVSFEVKLPDNLTQYRVWALAANDKQCGLGEMSFTVQLPIMIRPSLPRFLNYGDIAHLSVILQNQTDLSLLLHAGLRATNAKLLTSQVNQQSVGYSIMLQANKRTALTFPVTTIHSGIARFQFIISTIKNETCASFGDAIELSLPVFTPATSEAFATYGDVYEEEEVILQPIKTPKYVLPQFGELSITTSSTALASLTDAIISLYTYPYECTEQLSSRLLGIQSLWDVLQEFHSKELPDISILKIKLTSDINILKGRQYSNGGFGYWTNRNDSHPDPYMSVHVAHCLAVLVNKKVFDVDENMLNNALKYLENIESEIDQLPYSKYWSERTRFSLMSYALYVRAKYLQDISEQASELFQRTGFDKLSLEALGWLLVALSTNTMHNKDQTIELIYKYLKNKVNETSEIANFITSYHDDGQSVMLHSNQRTDAILLEALLYIDPKSTLCPKLCKGLQTHQVKGAWKSTQENCFVLIALNKYFHIKEKDTPDFVANIWFDNDYCGQHQYKDRTTNTYTINIPMKAILSSNIDKNIIIHKDGIGRLYYRIAMNYAPSNLQLKAVNYGFKIERTYTAIDDSSHVQKQSDGTWKFKLQEKIQVTLIMTTTQQRYHIALVDYLPAGCETLNTKLKGTLTSDIDSSVTRSKNNDCRLYSTIGWTEHENLRDERAEAFRSLLWPGVYEWSHVMRATCAGTFIIPPAKAEEMYSPENFGRCATEMVIID